MLSVDVLHALQALESVSGAAKKGAWLEELRYSTTRNGWSL
jgi:hypothetical protein